MPDSNTDLIVESLVINETMIHDMLVDYSTLPNYREDYKEDFVKLERIRTLIQELGGKVSHTSTEYW